MTDPHENPPLTEKEQEIIAVGASVASGCLPCTKFHLRAAASVGADAEETLMAVRQATVVRMAATVIMAKAGGWSGAELAPPPAAAEGSLLVHLVALSAAYAISCSTGMETHIGAARALGATDRQIYRALEIACRIRDVANRKAKSVAGAALGMSGDNATGCDCADEDAPSTERASGCATDQDGGQDSGGCSCRAEQDGSPKAKGAIS
jgi:AhpD family alkylhydroperoxidase